MKFMELARTLSPAAWILGVAAAVSFVLVAWWLMIGGPAHDRKATVLAQASAAYATGRADAAAEASAIVDQTHAAATASEDLTRRNADEIHATTGASVRLDLALNDAGRRGMCRRPGYRRTAECVQLLGPEEP